MCNISFCNIFSTITSTISGNLRKAFLSTLNVQRPRLHVYCPEKTHCSGSKSCHFHISFSTTLSMFQLGKRLQNGFAGKLITLWKSWKRLFQHTTVSGPHTKKKSLFHMTCWCRMQWTQHQGSSLVSVRPRYVRHIKDKNFVYWVFTGLY